MGRTGAALSMIALLALATSAWGQIQGVVAAVSSIGTAHEKVLAELLDKNQAEDAARYWGENRSYFWDNAEQFKPLLARLKSAVNTPHEQKMGELEATLKPFAGQALPLADWANVIRALAAARLELDGYRALPIAIDDSLRSERFIALDGTVNEVVQLYVNGAPAAFAQYDHFGNPPFNRTYPVDVPQELIAAGYVAMKPRLETASVAELAKFTEAYASALSGKQREELTRYVAQARYRELVPAGKLTAQAAAKLITEIAAGRLQAGALPLKLGFYWSQDAAKGGEVPIALKAPANIALAELARRDLAARLADAELVLYVDVDKPVASRNTKSTRHEYSRYKASEHQVINPAYLDAQALVQQKQIEQMRAESGGGMSFSLDPIALVAGLAKEAYTQAKSLAAKANLKQAQDQLANTPRMLNEDVMGDYQYVVADVEVTRRIPLAIYLIDVKSAGYLKQTTEVTEKQVFQTADELHPRDPDRDQILARYSASSAVSQYLATPVAIDAGVVLDAALGVVQGEVATQPLAGLAQEIERGAAQPPLAPVLANAGHCDAYFDNLIESLKLGRCAAEAQNLKGFIEAIGGPSRSVAETGILSTARTPELYKNVPANDERWMTLGESAQPNCGAPLAVHNPQDTFMECVRVLSCGARTAACGRELTRQNKAMACPEASQRCMVVYPIPQ